jgi:hypothetical protein
MLIDYEQIRLLLKLTDEASNVPSLARLAKSVNGLGILLREEYLEQERLSEQRMEEMQLGEGYAPERMYMRNIYNRDYDDIYAPYEPEPTEELMDGTPVWYDDEGAYTITYGYGEKIRIDEHGELIPNIEPDGGYDPAPDNDSE